MREATTLPWFQAPCEAWEVLAEHLSRTSGWGSEAIDIDLRYHQSRAIRDHRPVAFPTRAQLATRWGMSEKRTRGVLEAFFGALQTHLVDARRRAAWDAVVEAIHARRGPGKGQDGARMGPGAATANANNSQEKGQDGARMGPGKGLTRGESREERSEPDQSSPPTPLRGESDQAALEASASAALDALLSTPPDEVACWLCVDGHSATASSSVDGDEAVASVRAVVEQGACPCCGSTLSVAHVHVDEDQRPLLLAGLLQRQEAAVNALRRAMSYAGTIRSRELGVVAERLARRRAGPVQDGQHREGNQQPQEVT